MGGVRICLRLYQLTHSLDSSEYTKSLHVLGSGWSDVSTNELLNSIKTSLALLFPNYNMYLITLECPHT